MTENTAHLTIDGQPGSISLPIRGGNVGPDVIDVGALTNRGFFTYDPGFVSTAACESAITYIDGDAGVLMHRGYPIEQLAEHSSHLELCYLLLNGELPNKAQFSDFVTLIKNHTMVHEQLRTFFNGFRRDAHPMAIMCGVVGALSAFYHDSLNIDDPVHRKVTAHRLIAKMPTLAAMSYKYSKGQPFMYPRNDLDYAANFLYMMFGTPTANYDVDPILARAMDRIFLLHADHEQNASTSTVRLAGSTGANPFACIAAGIAALWGPAHGGANEAALNMLREIGSEDKIGAFIKRVKDKNSSVKLMGFGHRVYKSYDPRAKIIKRTAYEVFEVTGKNPLLDIALELERIALEDDYFVSRKLYPNVDFYSGLIYQAMGFPVDMFAVLFAIARTVGWVAQWEEMLLDSEQKIARPRQIYTGAGPRDYVPMGKR